MRAGMNAQGRISGVVVILFLVLGLSGCGGAGGGSEVIAAPTNLVATASASATEISLTWSGEPPSGGGFLVFRGTSAGGESTTPIGTCTTGSYTDTDATLQSSTWYYYYVVAGTETAVSAASNEASAQTVDGGSIGVTLE